MMDDRDPRCCNHLTCVTHLDKIVTDRDSLSAQLAEARATNAELWAGFNDVTAQRDEARTRLAAQETALREQIAAEIEAIPYSPELEHGDNGEWMQQEAARIARKEQP